MIRPCSRRLFVSFFTVFAIAVPVLVHAGDGFINLVGIPGLEPGSDPDMELYLESLLRIAIIAAALIAVIKLILAGAKYVLSDLVTSKEDAKRDIYGALVGLLIVLAAVTILRTINPDIMNLEPLTAPPRPELPEYVPPEDEPLDETADRYSCPGDDVEPFRNRDGDVVCVTAEQRDRLVIITPDNEDDISFEFLPLDRDAWADARQNEPMLRDYGQDDVIGYLEIDSPESNDLIRRYGGDTEAIREELMEPLCQENGGDRVIMVDQYVGTRAGFYCVRDGS